ncbi:exodeoxyribonuclease VII large subunit [Acinetobacter puyangensis]|uniref:Exodeoxyribonuclease 7 large subunit n=1 Tax=Acinetobacter puyangensis TaxID=1096779 RepID=A0A240E6L0_9GAMM|nr:exodeoxyribonuclease VII large subunit [Acinetobacter puyangensis]SNX44206.1 Exodeoxyribonuclease VII large subunit [Acinetobacter puyangensis]
MPDQQLSLTEYLSAIKEVIQISFDEAVWVKAEIRNLSVKGGHYYLELAEKEEDTDKVIASCRATIWKHTSKIVLRFQRESGIELSKDLNVLIKVKARFDPQYGFSLNIEDIDSSFTLGDIAKRYQQIVARLTEEGLINKNKLLPVPFDIQNVLVIAPQNAAGLGDFKKDADALDKAGVCHFVYHSATFQGNTAAVSIIESLSSGLRQWVKDYDGTPPDLIVIIRGGGAVNDLAYLNDYDLAALLCKRTVPIWVGIGHEKDRTILDEIAHRSFDTPSKVIAGIRNQIADRAQEVITFIQSIKLLSQHHIANYQNKNEQLIGTIKTVVQNQISMATKNLELMKGTTHYFAQQQIKIANSNVESLMRETLLQNPRNVLAKGYGIVRSNGKAIRSIHQISGTDISIEMQDGQIQATVNKVIDNDQ